MNSQEIFDAISIHLFTQGRQAKDDKTCVYRSKDGLKCAVGALIPDNLYSPAMDMDMEGYGTGVSGLLRSFGEILPSWFNENRSLLMNLQDVHDANDNWRTTWRMKSELIGVARYFGLNDTILNDLAFEKDSQNDDEY